MSSPRLYYHQFLVAPKLGGGEMVALRLAQHLAEQQSQPVIWTPGPGSVEAAARQSRLPCLQYSSAALFSNKLARAWASLGIVAQLRRRQPGVVHLHAPFLYGLLRPALKLTAMPAVVHFHLEPSREEIEWVLREPPAAIVTCAEFIARQAADVANELGAPADITAVPNGVDTVRFHPGSGPADKLQVGAPLDRPLVLMLANLAPHKGQETALRAAAMLKQRRRNLMFWFAGEERSGGSAFLRHLQQLSEELGVSDCIRFLGFRADAPQLLRAADMLLLPSTHEGLPLTLVEAQASKVPVIAAGTAGVPEIIRHAETGFLVAADDPEGYATTVELLLDQPALRTRVTEQAYRQATTNNSWNKFLERMDAVYAAVEPISAAARRVDRKQMERITTAQ